MIVSIGQSNVTMPSWVQSGHTNPLWAATSGVTNPPEIVSKESIVQESPLSETILSENVLKINADKNDLNTQFSNSIFGKTLSGYGMEANRLRVSLALEKKAITPKLEVLAENSNKFPEIQSLNNPPRSTLTSLNSSIVPSSTKMVNDSSMNIGYKESDQIQSARPESKAYAASQSIISSNPSPQPGSVFSLFI